MELTCPAFCSEYNPKLTCLVLRSDLVSHSCFCSPSQLEFTQKTLESFWRKCWKSLCCLSSADARRHNHQKVSPASIYGIIDIKRPLELLPELEWERKWNGWWGCPGTVCHPTGILKTWIRGMFWESGALTCPSGKWMTMTAEEVSSEVLLWRMSK